MRISPSSGGIRIQGGKALLAGELADAAIDIENDLIARLGGETGRGRALDASGLLVLPGIVDIHADAFERQLMPRPGVAFPIDVALIDSDRQAIANGITTLFHGVTWSWEPGLRGPENARAILDNLERCRPRLGADTHFHLRWEIFNLDHEDEVTDWLARRRVGMLGFNDHMLKDDATRERKLGQMADRSGLTRQDFLALVERMNARADDVPGSVERLAQAARAHGVPMLSHDDESPQQRRRYRRLGCRIAEFPTTVETAKEAVQAGDDIVLGAPNVVRGGSHIGWIGAAEMIARGCCSVLASDYYYPAPLLAAFRLAADEVVSLPQAWAYVSEQPAKAATLTDRGVIAPGKRADLLLVEAGDSRRPRVIAVIGRGRLLYLTEPGRLA